MRCSLPAAGSWQSPPLLRTIGPRSMSSSGALDWCPKLWARVYKFVADLPEDATAEALAVISDLARLTGGRLIDAVLDEAGTAIAEVRPLSEARPELDL